MKILRIISLGDDNDVVIVETEVMLQNALFDSPDCHDDLIRRFQDAFLQTVMEVAMQRCRIVLEGIVQPGIPIIKNKRQAELPFQRRSDQKICLWGSRGEN